MPYSEKTFNLLLGISILGWGLLGMRYAITNGELTTVRITISLLNLAVGSLILFRAPITQHGSLSHCLASLPSFALCGLAFRLSPATSGWQAPAQALFVAGGAWALMSFAFLGRNVAILPARRAITCSGPYRMIRHPAYLGELMMAAACCLSIQKLSAILLGGMILGGVIMRVVAEERLLCGSADYQSYKQTVRWRLLPLVW